MNELMNVTLPFFDDVSWLKEVLAGLVACHDVKRFLVLRAQSLLFQPDSKLRKLIPLVGNIFLSRNMYEGCVNG